MNLHIALTLLIGLFSWTAGAQTPVNTDVETQGYASFPVLQCPATNEAIKDFRKKLLDLKKAIKDEANCKGITADVSVLSELVTKERDTILALITKGQAEGLTDAEQGRVESYVEKITTTTSNVLAVITGNDACFDEDKQGMSLEFVTSLIGEGSKILAIIGGPEVGATIQIAGEVITGFLKAMKTIEQNRQGYKFKNVEQRMAYAESMCALFDYRRELEKLINPYDSVARLQQLQDVLEKQIAILRDNCMECRQIILLVEEEATKARETKNNTELRTQDIWPPAFEHKISQMAKEIDKLYTKRLGTHTYRSLKTITWIPLRMRSLEDNSLKADLGLEDIGSEMLSIEKFMITEQAPLFLKQLIVEAREWNSQLDQHLMGVVYTLRVLKNQYPNIQWPRLNWGGTVFGNTFEYYGQILESLDIARSQVNEDDRASIETYFKELENLARYFGIATDVADNYCSFFKKAHWYKKKKSAAAPDLIADVCGSPALANVRHASNMFTNYRMLMMPSTDPIGGSAPPMPSEPEVVVTEDWVESLTRVVDDMTRSSDYVTRQENPSEEILENRPDLNLPGVPGLDIPNFDVPLMQ